ncbi:putative peptidoglycan lipid II flippase [Micromonospora viridifaciens]|uniref:Putative peptidoglycan lipid II flippase n=1 Tax=Micromonospora viridifaciens TaxID=1881 RepID=A0A1C4YXD2_MICVI|nr:lipid II flippase MurJ [Micromonospora viridifaciens]SCF25344.1 putative peptidoglycan lipid II flippase [Micromonospora viridifaciens]
MTKPASLAGAGRVAGAAALIAILTVVSRLAGFGRTAVFTWTLAPTDLGGAYVIANNLPNFIFEIVAGGALASLVVPLLAGAVEAGDRRAVAATTGALLTWVLALLVPLAVLVALLADPLVSLQGGGLSEVQHQAGARMLRLFAPQLPLYGVGIVLTGVLQAHRRFAWPVIAPLLSSVTVIAVYLGFTAVEGRLATVGEVGRGGELLLSGGTTLGVVVLSLSLLIPLRRLRLPLRPGFRFPADARARVGGLAVAGVVTVAAQQVALMVALSQVSYGSKANPGIYNIAQTIYFLPWSVLAVPLAVAAYPTLAAARAAGDERTYRETLAPAVRGVVLFSLLGTAALVGTAIPVGHFFFAPDLAGPAAAAIAGFAPGLLGYGLFAVLTRALYARAETRSATVATAVGWLTVPVLAVLLGHLLPLADRVLAVALATSAGMLVLGGLLIAAVLRSAGRAALAGVGRAGAAGLLAAVVAGLGGAGASRWLAGLGTPTTAQALVQGMLCGAVVGVLFLAVAWLADARDVRPLLAAVARRLGRRRPPGGAGPQEDQRPADRGDGKETVTS